jgi:hypothetical protein
MEDSRGYRSDDEYSKVLSIAEEGKESSTNNNDKKTNTISIKNYSQKLINKKSEKKSTIVEGNLDNHTPLNIIDSVLLNENEIVLSCHVVFKSLKSGITPKSGWFLSTEIRKKAPNILIDYLLLNTKFSK